MDEIINYLDLPEEEKEPCLEELLKTSYGGPSRDIGRLKAEMNRSKADSLPQFVFVRRNGTVIGYLFLIAEKENPGEIFPWWAVDNSDELPLETDLRLLQYGVDLCTRAGCFRLAGRLKMQMENHRNGIGRRPEESAL